MGYPAQPVSARRGILRLRAPAWRDRFAQDDNKQKGKRSGQNDKVRARYLTMSD